MFNWLDEFLSFIKDEAIKQFVADIWFKYDIDNTMVKGASSTGKYHPTICNERYGLAHHTMLCLLAAERVMQLYRPMKKLTALDCDIIRAAIILHDGWKYTSINDKACTHTQKPHGFIGYQKILDFNSSLDLSTLNKIGDAVRLHMSNWCHDKLEIQTAQESKRLINHVVMMADMLASDKKLMEYCQKGGGR